LDGAEDERSGAVIAVARIRTKNGIRLGMVRIISGCSVAVKSEFGADERGQRRGRSTTEHTEDTETEQIRSKVFLRVLRGLCVQFSALSMAKARFLNTEGAENSENHRGGFDGQRRVSFFRVFSVIRSFVVTASCS